MAVTFRIDDVSLNTSKTRLHEMISLIENRVENCEFLLAISPIVFDMSSEVKLSAERIFPKILNAHSDFKKFFKGNKIGKPKFLNELNEKSNLKLASHGLIHVDHRLLTRSAQEISILISCAITESNIFVPPFNKWNSKTETVCQENKIELIKFEDGWKHVAHQKFNNDGENQKYYFHTHDFELDFIENWLDN